MSLRAKSMFLYLTTIMRKWSLRDALSYFADIMWLMMQAQALSIHLLHLELRTTQSVWKTISLIQTTHVSVLMTQDSILTESLITKESTLRMLTRKSLQILRPREDCWRTAPWYTAIQCVGDQKSHLFTKQFIAGSSESQSLRKDSWPTISSHVGYLSLPSYKGSKSGLKMSTTGASHETDTGATQYQFGPQKTMKKLWLWDQ